MGCAIALTVFGSVGLILFAAQMASDGQPLWGAIIGPFCFFALLWVQSVMPARFEEEIAGETDIKVVAHTHMPKAVPLWIIASLALTIYCVGLKLGLIAP